MFTHEENSVIVPRISDDSHLNVMKLVSQNMDGEGNTGGVSAS